jgi:hypothetical protein
MGFHQRFACSCGRGELLIRYSGLILDHPNVPPGRGRTLLVPRLFSEMFKLTFFPSAPKRTNRCRRQISLSHELSLGSHPSPLSGRRCPPSLRTHHLVAGKFREGLG